MKTITVLTPTYNRSETLPRLYNSLKNQTDQDFLWLVIDDGSTDDTESIVRGWINEKKIEIVYHKINKGGQHKALQLGFNSAQTEYLVKIDSDDAFVPDAIDTYKRCWSLIESDNKKNIGNICALSRFENNEIDGNWKFPHDTYYIDSNWHEMVLRKGNNNELSYCTRTSILREIYPLSYTFWNEDKLHVISPAIFTSRIGRQCNTRFINKIVQVVYLDAPFSILRPKEKQTNRFLKVLVDTKYFLDENIDYFFWNPKYYINQIIKMTLSSIISGVGIRELWKQISKRRLKLLVFLLSPLSLAAQLYFKFVKRKFWI